MTAVLDPRPAADLIERDGWTQRQMYDGAAACLTGGLLRACQPGEAQLLVQVYRHWGLAEDWNDEGGRTKDEVVEALRRDVTEADMLATFGLQWQAIKALVVRAAHLTADEAERLDAARHSARHSAGYATWYGAWNAAASAADVSRNAAADVSRNAAVDAASPAAAAAGYARHAKYAAGSAALALVVRDLIGQHGFTQEHYDTLTGPWASVIGPVHPDDAAVTE